MTFLLNFEPDLTNQGLESQRRLLPERLALVRVAALAVPLLRSRRGSGCFQAGPLATERLFNYLSALTF